MNSSFDTIISALQHGDPVGFPTETVYGLAANAYNDAAVSKIFLLKKRPSFNPLISHVTSIKAVERFAVVCPMAKKLAKTFWPGPLTFILKQKPGTNISKLVTANLDTVAVRCPAHPFAQKILNAIDFPLAAPSANISESVSPTTAQHVLEAFPALPVLDGGPCQAGVESTILDLSTDEPRILRPGTITLEQIQECLGSPVLPFTPDLQSSSSVRCPGQTLRHYSPVKRVRINVSFVEPGEGLLDFGASGLKSDISLNLSPSGDLSEAASNLFAYLRQLDQSSATGIAITPIPNTGIGIAINDRVRRASQSG